MGNTVEIGTPWAQETRESDVSCNLVLIFTVVLGTLICKLRDLG